MDGEEVDRLLLDSEWEEMAMAHDLTRNMTTEQFIRWLDAELQDVSRNQPSNGR